MADYNDAKPAIIGAETVLSLTVNSLVIAVIARYPEIRKDRTALFMLSISVADLATGCTVMPLAAAVCSRATPSIRDELQYLPKLFGMALWWFGFVSVYCLCWMTMTKAVTIIAPFRAEKWLSHKRCQIIIATTWIVGFLLSTLNVMGDATWNVSMCNFRYPDIPGLGPVYQAYFLVAGVVPRVLLLYFTVRIFIVVLRVHRQIADQADAVITGEIEPSTRDNVTARALRSSINVIAICVVAIILTTPVFVFSIAHNITGAALPVGFDFAAMWLLKFGTIINSFLYLFLFRSVRKKVCQMFNEMLARIRGS